MISRAKAFVLSASLLSFACGESTAEDVELAEAAQTSAAVAFGPVLVSGGFRLARTDSFAYEAGPDTRGELVCQGTEGDPSRRCTELVCSGLVEDQTRICHPIVQEAGRFVVTGKADRYEHADGRIAYVVRNGEERLVGPVRRGTHSFRGAAASGQASLAVRDLVFGDRGDVRLSVGLSLGGGALESKELLFDTAQSRFAEDGVSVGYDTELGLLRNLELPATASFAIAEGSFTSEDGRETTPIRLRWVGRWFLPTLLSSSPGCSPDKGVLIDVEAHDARSRRIDATIRSVSNAVRAPNGDVVLFGSTRKMASSERFSVRFISSSPGDHYSLPNNNYRSIVMNEGTLVPRTTDGYGLAGWPHYLASFPIHKTCVAAKVR
jgi:hypothetical protein